MVDIILYINTNQRGKTMRVLVTGGAGYLGSVLCQQLLWDGHDVTCVDNLMYGQGNLFHLVSYSGFRFVRADVKDLDRRLIQHADVIIPLAAIVGAPACDKDQINAWNVNYEAINKLMAQVTDQLVIFPNTNSGYGHNTKSVCTEDTPMRSLSLYAESKSMAENRVMQYGNSIGFRLATVFGCSPRMRLDLLVNDFTYRAVTDGFLVLYEPDAMRNYVHIRDVADAFCFAIDNQDLMVGEVYNLGNDSANCSKIELANKIAEHVPGLQVYVSADGEDPDKRNYTVSSDKLARVEFVAEKSLDAGIEELIKGYKLLGRGGHGNV